MAEVTLKQSREQHNQLILDLQSRYENILIEKRNKYQVQEAIGPQYFKRREDDEDRSKTKQQPQEEQSGNKEMGKGKGKKVHFQEPGKTENGNNLITPMNENDSIIGLDQTGISGLDASVIMPLNNKNDS